jgi:predicted secreted protein
MHPIVRFYRMACMAVHGILTFVKIFFRESAMRNFIGVIIVILFLTGGYSQALAAKPAKEAKPVKEPLVLMPLRVSEEDKSLQGAMETALVEGLQKKYKVFSGEQVARKARDIFNKESRVTAKKECDETRCMQDIAMSFQAELLAIANVTKRDGGYFLALSIKNILDNLEVYSKSLPCENCSTFQVIEKLKELSGATISGTQPSGGLPDMASGKDSDPEAVLWNEVKNTNLIDDYETYLAQYPKGKYVALAKSRIKKVTEVAASESARKEDTIWQAAEKTGGEEDYQGYVKEYPQGKYFGLALIRIRKLQAEQSVRRAQENEDWQKVRVSRDAGLVQGYLDKYPRGKYAAEAIGRIAELRKTKEMDQSPISYVTGDDKIIKSIRSGNFETDSSITIITPDLAENGSVVPVEISVARSFSKGERLYLIVNDSYIGASLTPYDNRTQIFLSARVKMRVSGPIKAALVDASGRIRIASKDVRVMRGEDPNASIGQPSFGGIKMQVVKTVSMYVRALLDSSQNRELYVKTINVMVDGTRVAEIGLTPGASKNPFLGVKLNGSAGKVELQLLASNGEKKSGEADVQ